MDQLYVLALIITVSSLSSADIENICSSANMSGCSDTGCCILGSRVRCIICSPKYMQPNLTQLVDKGFGKNVTEMCLVSDGAWQGKFPTWEVEPLDITPLKNFTELRILSILPTNSMVDLHRLQFDNDTFKGCNKIEKLSINVPIRDTDLSSVLAPLKNLTDLDFNNLRGISYGQMNKSMQSLSLETIETLRLSRFQTVGQTEYKAVFIVSTFFAGQLTRLKFLDLSNNGFALMFTGFSSIAPNLECLNISHNLLTYGTNTPVLLEVLMHPTIIYLSIGHQGYLDDVPYEEIYNTTAGSSNQRNGVVRDLKERLTDQPVSSCIPGNYSEDKEMGVFIQCVNNVTNGNVSELFGECPSNCSAWCTFIRKCTLLSFKHFSCNNLTSLAKLYDQHCSFYIKIPIGKKLQFVHFQNTYFDIASHTGVTARGTFCLTENNLREIDFSSNFYWATAARISDSINNIHNVSGISNLKKLNLSNNQFSINLTNAAIAFPNLTHLDMSRNSVSIQLNTTSLCRDKDIHSLKYINLSYNSLDIGNLSSELIVNCTKLKYLGLAGNKLRDPFTLNFNGTESLTIIDLSRNQFTVFNKDFMRGIEEHEHLTIDISENKLLCGCKKEALEFLKWVHNKEVNKKIKDFHLLKCTSDKGIVYLSSIHYRQHWAECHHVIPILVAVLVTTVTGLAILSTIYGIKYRYRLRYALFKMRKRLCNVVSSSSVKYEYDAYVGIVDNDFRLFYTIDELAKTHGFRISYRTDVVVGTYTSDAIDELIKNSKEFIIVLSSAYLNDHTSVSEMEELYRLARERERPILVITPDNLPDNICLRIANKILDRNPHVPWKTGLGCSKSTNSGCLSISELEAMRKTFCEMLVEHVYGGARAWTNCCCKRHQTEYQPLQGDDNP